MNDERLKYLQRFVFGTPEARELLEHERDLLLTQMHQPHVNDPYNEGAKRAMAVAEMYQFYININKQLTEGKDDRTNTSGQPSI